LINILEGTNRLHAGKNFTIGVCPENANPGEILHDFTNLPRLVGGIDQQSTKIITMIYDFVFSVELIIMPDCKTANAVKLTTNVFRDVNIGFVNELSLMFDKLGIDTLKVLDAAKRKYNFQIHYPGPGVGGPCLPINSYQFLNTAARTNSKLSIIEQGRKINEKMPEYVVNLTLDGFKISKKSIKDSSILILGISYKPDVKDIQLSPAEIIINKLKTLGAKIKIYDPYFKGSQVFGINVEQNIDDILSKVDAAIIVTAHKEFQEIDPKIFSKMKTPILIDSRGIIDPVSAKNTGLVFRGLGRGI
jgi:nucleotide sugar dehydrogenase